jgi:hypothetical protein
MGLKYHQFGNVTVNLWHGELIRAEAETSIRQAQASAALHGPITGIAILDRDLRFPLDPDVDKYMKEMRQVMLGCHRSMHVVMPKKHFPLMRVGMYIVSFLTMGTGSEVVHHTNVPDALKEADRIRRSTPGLPGFSVSQGEILQSLQRLKIPLE